MQMTHGTESERVRRFVRQISWKSTFHGDKITFRNGGELCVQHLCKLNVHNALYIKSQGNVQMLMYITSERMIQLQWTQNSAVACTCPIGASNSIQQSPSSEAYKSSESQEISRILLKQNVHYRIYNSRPPVPILSHNNPFHAPHPISLTTILILSSHLYVGLPSDLFP
jgi:hypothetical protein